MLLALNLLLPYGLSTEMSDAELLTATAASRGQCGSLISSLEVAGRNEKLKHYIENNAMMLLDFLRLRLSSRRATVADQRAALNALHHLLRIYEQESADGLLQRPQRSQARLRYSDYFDLPRSACARVE